MTLRLADHLAGGGALVMLNPRGDEVPDVLGAVNALFIDREGTGLTLADAALMVARAARLGLYSVVRCDGTRADELANCAGLSPDAVVLPQLRSADEIGTCLDTLGPVPTIAQIETVEAVESIDAFAAVPGPVAFLIGPYDLAAEMGHPGEPDRPEVAETVERAARRLATAGRPFGLPTLDAAAREHWTERGAQLSYITIPALQEMTASA